jgi:hypothetical protein
MPSTAMVAPPPLGWRSMTTDLDTLLRRVAQHDTAAFAEFIVMWTYAGLGCQSTVVE